MPRCRAGKWFKGTLNRQLAILPYGFCILSSILLELALCLDTASIGASPDACAALSQLLLGLYLLPEYVRMVACGVIMSHTCMVLKAHGLCKWVTGTDSGTKFALPDKVLSSLVRWMSQAAFLTDTAVQSQMYICTYGRYAYVSHTYVRQALLQSLRYISSVVPVTLMQPSS